MELTTIIGIIIAVGIMLIGLRIMLKKPVETTPSLDSDIHINSDSQQPIIPRHVRDQLSQNERTEPTLSPETETITPPATEVAKTEEKAVEDQHIADDVKTQDNVLTAKPEPLDQLTTADKDLTTTETPVEPSVALPKTQSAVVTQVDKVEISEFEEESSILDAHLYEQKERDDSCDLANAETYLVLNVYPDQSQRVLSGEKTLKVLLKYGLRYGEMQCFHRYNDDDNTLLFSVLQVTESNPIGFDLETLSTEEVKGLSFFLALPHTDVQNAFDTMDSISRLVAREIQGVVYDQNNQEFTQQLREYWRHQAIDFRSGQQLGS